MKRIYRISVLFFLITTLSCSASAETNFGYWIGIFPHYQLDESQNLSLQAEYREINQNSTGLFRPSHHFKITKYVTLGLGYDLFVQNVREQRAWPELSGHVSISKLGIVFDWRARHEFRFRQGVSRTGERTRIMVGAHFDWPSHEDYSLYVFNEYFYLNHDFSKQTNRFDRNWLGTRLRHHFENYYLDYAVFWETASGSDDSNLYGLISLGWNM